MDAPWMNGPDGTEEELRAYRDGYDQALRDCIKAFELDSKRLPNNRSFNGYAIGKIHSVFPTTKLNAPTVAKDE